MSRESKLGRSLQTANEGHSSLLGAGLPVEIGFQETWLYARKSPAYALSAAPRALLISLSKMLFISTLILMATDLSSAPIPFQKRGRSREAPACLLRALGTSIVSGAQGNS